MARARAHAWMKFTRPKVGTRGRMAEVGYSKSQPESKFDFRAARAIIGQQFFSSRISFSFPPPLPRFSSPLPPRPVFAAGEQLGQKLRKLVKGRICWKSGYCEWQLAVHYSWITATPVDGELAEERKTERVGGGERMEECVCVCVGEKKNKRAKETRWMWRWKREVPSENIENRAYHSAK